MSRRGPERRLTWRQVLEIRRRGAAGERPAELARRFNYDAGNIAAILAGRVWKGEPTTRVEVAGRTLKLTAAQLRDAIRVMTAALAALEGEQ